MKTNVLFFLMLFSIFIIGPTIISICDKESNIIEFSMGEEEKTDTSLVDSEKHPLETFVLPESICNGIQKTIPPTSFELVLEIWYPDTLSPPPESIVI